MERLRDRAEAGARLAELLGAYRGERPLVLAIPRGGVPLGRILADALDGDLDVILVHKIGAPRQPELAIGSVDERGHVVLDPLARELGVPAEAVQAIAGREVAALRARRARLGGRPPASAQDRVVILVDDGIATGSTVRAAIRAVRADRPRRVVVATGVAPPSTIRELGEDAEEVVSVLAPWDFQAVGQFYRDFGEVSDDDVLRALGPAP